MDIFFIFSIRIIGFFKEGRDLSLLSNLKFLEGSNFFNAKVSLHFYNHYYSKFTSHLFLEVEVEVEVAPDLLI